MKIFLNTLRRQYYLYPIFSLIEEYKVKRDIEKEKVLVYQMGKVGSSTVYETVKGMGLDCSISHIHFLSDSGISKAEHTFLNSKLKQIPMHLRRSKILKKYLNFKSDKIKIISLTRDPVSRIISDVFQNLKYFHSDSLLANASVDIEMVQKVISDRLLLSSAEEEFAANWFDVEFKEILDIDVYSEDFNKEQGYTIIRNKNIEILLLNMEDMNSILPNALQEFFNYNSKISLKHENIGDNKAYSYEQNIIKNQVSIDRNILSCFYSTKYMRHFYSDSKIQRFINRWVA